VISKDKANDDVADKEIDGQRNCEDSGCEEVIEEEGDNYIENNILLFTFNPLFREIFLKRTFFSIKSFLFIGFTAVVRILNKQGFSNKILQLTIIQYEVAKD